MINKYAQWTMAAVLLATVVCGQQTERENNRRQRMGGVAKENWIANRVASKDFLNKVGIQGEQAEKLKASMESIDKQSAKLNEQIKVAAAKQAQIAKKVLAEPGASVDEIMKVIDEIGKLRTEQAKLATQRLVVIRDNLTAEQREKASTLLSEEQKKWREEKEKEKGTQGNRPAASKGR